MAARTHTVVFRVSPAEEKSLDTEADRLGLSRSDLVRMYVKEGLERAAVMDPVQQEIARRVSEGMTKRMLAALAAETKEQE